MGSQREMKDEVTRAAMLLPAERHRVIGTLNNVMGNLPDADRTTMQRLIQAAESEEPLAKQLQEEGCASAVRVMCQCIATTHGLEHVGPLLELLVLLLKCDASFAHAFSVHAEQLDNTKDPGLHLKEWAQDDTGKIVFKAMEAFSVILAGATESYRAKWVGSLLRVIHSRIHEARAATEDNAASMIKTAEAAVRGLSTLCGPIELRPAVLKPASQDSGLSTAALLPALLFPGENVFAGYVEDHHQFIYDACKCLWLLSFEGEQLTLLDEQCRQDATVGTRNIITVLNNLLKKQKKEKCVRMVLLVLQNYVRQHAVLRPSSSLAYHGPNYLKDMIGVGMVQNLEMLQKRTFGDEDILPDIHSLLELLEENVEDLSSYAMYKQEVASGELEWSPPHTSEKFWRESIKAFEADSYQPIKDLAKIIANSKKILNIQIACHDIGEFVRHHPQGKRIWEKLGIKERVYDLIESGAGGTEAEKENVKKEALLCMQKIMVQRWEFL